MGRETKKIVIGKTDYELTKLGGATGSELWLDLLHVAVVPIDSLSTATELDEKAIVKAISSTIRTLDHATMRKLYGAFGAVSRIRVPNAQGDRWPTLEGAVFDDHFAGNYVELTEWVVQSVLFNFFGFLGDGSLDSLIGRLRAMVPAKSTTTSTGSSGDR